MQLHTIVNKYFSLVSLFRAPLRGLFLGGAALGLVACGGSSSGGDAATPSGYPLAGTISGLDAAGLVLQNNGEDLSVPARATSFRFTADLAAGSAYNVTIAAQPAGLTCTVGHGSGSNVRAAVGNVTVACSAITHTLAGTVSGLNTSGLVLRNEGGDDLAIAANATTFQFGTPIAQGGDYSVIVAAQPTGLTCTVGQGSGTQIRADINNIDVVCSASTLTVGGTISGLAGSGLVLRNNNGDDLAVAGNATTFEFATPVAYGGSYAVTVATQPAGQTCTPANASGTATVQVADVSISCANIPVFTVTPNAGSHGSISPATPQSVTGGGNIAFVAIPDSGYSVDQWLLDGNTAQSGGSVYNLNNVSANHTVSVLFAQTTLTISTASLALSVNDIATNAALTGNPRQITITNTGFIAALNVATNTSGWPVDTTLSSSTCSGALAPGASCFVRITPGSTPSSNCNTGIAPTPGTLTVTADNANSSQAEVTVLTYGCIYQGGLLYAVDDSTADTGSIGGSVVSLIDNNILEWGGVGTAVNASSLTDGAFNTATIVTALGASPYAAQACSIFEIDSDGNVPCASGSCYADWHLPAICEWSYDGISTGSGCGTVAAPSAQNIQSSLVDELIPGYPAGASYWSSTESNSNSISDAWSHSPVPGSAIQLPANKAGFQFVRCARPLTH